MDNNVLQVETADLKLSGLSFYENLSSSNTVIRKMEISTDIMNNLAKKRVLLMCMLLQKYKNRCVEVILTTLYTTLLEAMKVHQCMLIRTGCSGVWILPESSSIATHTT